MGKFRVWYRTKDGFESYVDFCAVNKLMVWELFNEWVKDSHLDIEFADSRRLRADEI